FECVVRNNNCPPSRLQHPVSLRTWGGLPLRLSCSVQAIVPSACNIVCTCTCPATPGSLSLPNQFPTQASPAAAGTHATGSLLFAGLPPCLPAHPASNTAVTANATPARQPPH